MSRWLQNVGHFLEKLDDRAEQVVEEQRLLRTEEEEVDEDTHLETILAARGLANEDAALLVSPEKEQGEEQESSEIIEQQLQHESIAVTEIPLDDSWNNAAFETVQQEAVSTEQETEIITPAPPEMEDFELSYTQTAPQDEQHNLQLQQQQQPSNSSTQEEEEQKEGEQKEEEEQVVERANNDQMETGNDAFTGGESSSNDGLESNNNTTTTNNNTPSTTSTLLFGSDDVMGVAVGLGETTPVSKKIQQEKNVMLLETPFATPAQIPQKGGGGLGGALENASVASSSVAASRVPGQDASAAIKEARKLRRHVVTLNAQLEKAEAEILAQRQELERAADRMEKDRLRQKEVREKEKARHAEEIKTLKAQQEQAMKDVRLRADKQVEDMRRQLRQAEELRMQEGGDLSKEMELIVQREHETMQRLLIAEDEKTTLLSQINTLQAQQEALGSRLESLTQTADNAMEREREAENRLDEALSLHARQISQRQAREAELERMLADLGAQLVAAQEKVVEVSGDQAPGDLTAQGVSDGHVRSLESEMEALRAQLVHERQRNDMLQRELKEFSKETKEEATILHARQLQHDRQVVELNQTISKLKAELRDAKVNTKRGNSGDGNAMAENNEDLQRIKSLSEEVLRLRDSVSHASSENSALKYRLQDALDRANRSEAALQEREEERWNDVERGNALRRRGDRVKSRTLTTVPSMRSVLLLDGVQGQSGERIGKTLDALDAFLVRSGNTLRHNPLARMLFILYLLLLHLWTFVVLFFHAHGFETVHGDFGTNKLAQHGPSSLLQPVPAHIVEHLQANEVQH